MTELRCAAYARISTDRQNPLSIEDQLRKCREFAEREGWVLLAPHAYSDEAFSGAGIDRPGFQRLLEAAFSSPVPFDAVLVDDTSRLSRNRADIARIFERLNFAGIRLIAVSQGIDTESEQADVLLTVHGLVDSLYVKELAKKTHRGMEGLFKRGLHTGGRCYGYRNISGSDGVKLEVDEAEAAVVRRIFEMAAAGHSLRTITRTLNAEKIPPPRPRARKRYATWCPTCIQPMLRRERYVGRVVWNRSKFVKVPGTNKRVRRARPENEWKRAERPELRIVSPELWDGVQRRLAWVKQTFGGRYRAGLLLRSATGPYLLSGLLKCGVCGANLVIVTGRGPGRVSKYGCPQNHYRGACPNNLTERREWLEERLLRELQTEVLKPAVVNYAVEEFGRQLKAALGNLSGEVGRMRERKATVERELSNLTAAVAAAGHSPFLLEQIALRERELREITERTLSSAPDSIEAGLTEIREYVTQGLADLRSLLSRDARLARTELLQHVSEIRMMPQGGPAGRYYIAEGQWNLLGDSAQKDQTRQTSAWRVRMVAGARFELATFGL